MKRAFCHEAGHAVVAMHYGLKVERISISRRIPQVLICPADWQRTQFQERYVFLASGIAGEKLVMGDYCKEGLTTDQKMISGLGGKAITCYLPIALKILEANSTFLNRIVQRLSENWITSRVEATFDLDPDSYDLLTDTELGLMV